MPKDLNIKSLYQDLGYIIEPTYIHDFLFRQFPPVKGKSVLEPGCGCAKFSIAYSLKGCAVDAFDIDQSVLKYATRLAVVAERLTDRPMDITIYSADFFSAMSHLGSNSYDLVFNEGFSHHFTDERRQLSIDLMANVAKEMVIIIGNNGENPDQVKRYQNVEFQYEGMPPQARFFTLDELEERMVKAGLKRVTACCVSPFESIVTINPNQYDYIAGIGYKE